MWDKVGDKLASAIIGMNIPMEDLPFVDGRFDVVTFLKTWQKGKGQRSHKRQVGVHTMIQDGCESWQKEMQGIFSEFVIKEIINPMLIKEGLDPNTAGIKIEFKDKKPLTLKDITESEDD